ncbi:MAG: zinc ribbon domain-containing protein [Chloroflexi bacterium]|nr:zinc ribbon domain-containing protein [Chloroflexota bacterium]MBU1747031.1 zinc ribbon domain-containing protein [Chloroflexota bacterium]
MPVYEYVCPDCGCKFELLRPMSRRDQTTTCPQCGGSQAGRQLSRFVARSALDSDVMNYASNAVNTSRSSGSSCASCSASSCAGCK